MTKPTWVKYWITRAGEHVSPTTVANLNHMLNFWKLGAGCASKATTPATVRMPGAAVRFSGAAGSRSGMCSTWSLASGREMRLVTGQSCCVTHCRSCTGSIAFEGLPEDWDLG